MQRTRRITVALTALAAAAAFGLPSASVQAAPKAVAPQATGCKPTWKEFDTSNIPTLGISDAWSITAPSRDDVWMTRVNTNPDEQNLVLRWNGKSLGSATSPPVFPHHQFRIEHTSLSSDTEGWALGRSRGPSTVEQTVAEHLHGGQWTMTALPVPSDAQSTATLYNNIASVSATDAWAVGGLSKAGLATPRGGADFIGALIAHWDGTEWSTVPNPAAHTDTAQLDTIEATSASDVWAAGFQGDGSGNVVPLVEHFDGTAWKALPTPSSVGQPAELLSVSATGPNDVWAVGGQTQNGGAHFSTPLIEHFDGTAWNVVTGLPDTGRSQYPDVYASGPHDVWALVQSVGGGTADEVQHFDGTTWTTVPLPHPQGVNARALYVALNGSGPDDIWATGAFLFPGVSGLRTQIAHLSCGKE